MRNRIERLRLYLVVSAGLLLAVLVGFIGTARYLKRHALARLGSKLGVDIRSETNGFTYSQSLQGRTIYTIHAAKEIEHANGVIGLHDVSMIVYGRTGDRADMVYGNEFQYDKNAGEVRAIGLVHIDVGGAGSGTHGSAAERQLLAQGHDDPTQGPQLLHATTSGLVYLDKLGVAATQEPIDFQTGNIKGHAVGADYNTDTGVLLLHSAVNISGIRNGHPVNLTAAAAQLDNRGQRAVLSHARYWSADQAMQANQVILHTRPDNSLEHVEADGDVHVQQRGADLSSTHADLTLDSKNKPERSIFTGGVRYVRDEPLRQARGEAQQMQIAFDADGSPVHATFTSAVHLLERSRATEDPKQPWAVRDLTADKLETALTATAPGTSELREVQATGGVHLTLVDNGTAASHGRGTTELAGDTLSAHLLPPAALKQAPRLDTLSAQGHTVLREINAEGLDQTSSGDTLNAHFRAVTPSPSRQAKDSSSGGEELASAVQTGHVHITRISAPKSSTQTGAPAQSEGPQNATADRAAYDGDTNRLTLTGGVRLQQTDSILLTNQLAFDRASGDAQAEGAVRVSYLTPPAPTPSGTGSAQANRDPLHILADRAEMKHATQLATFFGHPVRLWQGGSQLQAPVIELSRAQHTLAAHGDTQIRSGSSAAPVQTLLINSTPAHASTASTQKAATATPKTPQAVRILSRELLYSDSDRKAQFNGPVSIESSGETIRAHSATAYLQQPTAEATPPKTAAPAPISLEGRLDHVIATGDVVIEQPGHRATGSRVVYLAQDSSVLLTGDRATPPHVLDTDRGTSVTALAFRFHLGDDSIEALSSLPGDTDRQQVQTQTPAHR